MNAKIMNKISIIGRKKEELLDTLRVRIEIRNIMKKVRASARKGKYHTRYHADNVDSKNSNKVIEAMEKKGYHCSKIKEMTSFGMYEGIDIEWNGKN